MERLRPGDPEVIGPHRLLGRLGEGGMGTVFLARTGSGRRVAVKLLKPELASDAGFRARFAREVAAARQVGGLHTARVVDADAEADPPWLATEYIDGDTLRQRVRRDGPLGVDGLRELGAGLSEGLSAIHAAGVVHRDLKPDNVVMGPDGPRIIDFGIARAVDSSTLTAAGTVVGTYAYMAPEQIRADRADPASDVFALGCVLVFAATGAGPFEASTVPAIMHRVLNEEPELDGVPAGLREPVAGCLAKEAANRPSIVELLDRLTVEKSAPSAGEARGAGPTPVIDGTRVAAAPGAPTSVWPGGETIVEATPVVPRRKRLPRRKLLFGAVTAAAALAGPTVALWALSDGEPSKPRYLEVDDKTDTDKEILTATFSPDGETVAGVVTGGGSYVQLWDVTSGRRGARLEGGTTGELNCLAFSPDGGLLAVGGERVSLWNLDSRAETKSAVFGGPVQSLAFDPEGTSLVVGTGKGLSVWNPVLGAERTLHYDDSGSVAVSPDGSLVAWLGTGSEVWTLADGEALPGLLHIGGPGQVAFSPDGATLYAAVGAGEDAQDVGLHAWSVADRTESTLAGGEFRALAVHPDGGSVATSGEWRIKLWDIETGDVKTTFDNDEARSLSFSPDGTLLAAVREHSRWKVTLYPVE